MVMMLKLLLNIYIYVHNSVGKHNCGEFINILHKIQLVSIAA